MVMIAHVFLESFERPFRIGDIGATLKLSPCVGLATWSNEWVLGANWLTLLGARLSRVYTVIKMALLGRPVVLICVARSRRLHG